MPDVDRGGLLRRMKPANLVLPAAALALAACGSAPVTTAPAPSGSLAPLIAKSAMDVATCHQFAAEQAGQLTADAFNAWLLRSGGQPTIGPTSLSGPDNTLSTTLSDWYVVQASAPSGDLQTAGYYAAEVRAQCRSIGA